MVDPAAQYRWQFTLSVSTLAASAAFLTLAIVADDWPPPIVWALRVVAALLFLLSACILVAGFRNRPNARHEAKWCQVQRLIREAGRLSDSLAVLDDGHDTTTLSGTVATWIGDVRDALKHVDPALLDRFHSGSVHAIPVGAGQLRSYLSDRARELRTFITEDR